MTEEYLNKSINEIANYIDEFNIFDFNKFINSLILNIELLKSTQEYQSNRIKLLEDEILKLKENK